MTGHYGVLGFRSRSVPRSRRSVVSTWFSRIRPYDRSLHKSSEKSSLSASDETPSANSVPGSTSGVDDQLPPVFSPPSSRNAGMSGTACLVSGQWDACSPLAPFGLPRILLETNPDFRDCPEREGSNHFITSGLHAFLCLGPETCHMLDQQIVIPCSFAFSPICGRHGCRDCWRNVGGRRSN